MSPSYTPEQRARLRMLRTSLMAVTLLIAMDQTVLATAVPQIVGSLGGARMLGWVFASYTLGMTVAMPVAGRLGDLHGRRRLFLGAVVAFTLSSVVCGFATTMPAFLAARFLQGVAGGGIAVLVQAVAADAVAARHRARFQAPIGAVFLVASVAGPLLGGAITDTVGWRWIFWANAPIGVAALGLAAVSVPRVRPARSDERFDALGAALLAGWLTGVVVLAAVGGSTYSWFSAEALGLAATTGLLVTAYVVHSRRTAHPVIPVEVLASRTFAICAVLAFVTGAGVFGVIGYAPGLMQAVYGLSASESGLVILPMVLGILSAGFLSGHLVSRSGRYRWYPVVGCVVSGAGLAWLAFLEPGSPIWAVPLGTLLLGFGVGLFGQVVTVAVQNAAPHRVVASATSANHLVRELGIAAGSAALGGLFAARLAGALGSEAGLASLSPERMQALPVATRDLYAAAYLDAFGPLLLGLVVLFLLGALVALWLPEHELADELPEPELALTR